MWGQLLIRRERVFLWRPYAKVLNNKLFYKFYSEKEEWVRVSPCLDEELESFGRCSRYVSCLD